MGVIAWIIVVIVAFVFGAIAAARLFDPKDL